MNRQASSLRAYIAVFSLLLLSACGREADPVPQEWNDLTSMYGLPSVVATTEAQNEVQSVLEEVNNHIFSAAVQATSSNGIVGTYKVNSATQTASATACKPTLTLVAIGVGLKFSDANGCFLDGTISVNLFPLSVKVDLKVVGLKFVQGITLKGDMALKGGATSSIELLIQNGKVNLKLGSMFPDGFVLSGRSKFSFGNGSSGITSRTNAFEPNTKAGVAIVAEINKNGKKVESCFLAGGDPVNPEAGVLAACFALIK